jgi:hypothetical protein
MCGVFKIAVRRKKNEEETVMNGNAEKVSFEKRHVGLPLA